MAKEYDSKSQVLYRMDRGMTLHLAGRYEGGRGAGKSRSGSRPTVYPRLTNQTKSILFNDTELPYEGDLHEQVMINVLKALNYVGLGQLNEALVEARQIDHRLNVLSDKVSDKNSYREDPFARYLTGILYEASGDLNNAFIAYRKAYEAYQASRGWLRVPSPPCWVPICFAPARRFT